SVHRPFDVRFWPKADIASCTAHVRCTFGSMPTCCGAGSVGIAGINYHYVGKPTDDSSLQGLPRQHHRPRLCLQASVTERPIALPPGKGSVPCRNHTSYLLPSHRCRVTSRRFLASTAERRRI